MEKKDNLPITFQELVRLIGSFTSESVKGIFYRVDDWTGEKPICDEPLSEPAIYWAIGVHSSCNGADRLGLQFDRQHLLHVVYVWYPNWSSYRPEPIRKVIEPSELLGVPAEQARKTITDAIAWVFAQR